MGASFCLSGLSHQALGELDRAESSFKQGVSLLEQAFQNRELARRHPYLITRKLADAYDSLAVIISLHRGHAEQHLQYRVKGLRCLELINPEEAKDQKAQVADALHILGAIKEEEGNSREAQYLFCEAEELFASCAKDSAGMFETFAFGYFLYRRKKFCESRQMLLQCYHNCITSKDGDIVGLAKQDWPILTEELQFEVEHAANKSFIVPTELAALYFYIMTLVYEPEPNSANLNQALTIAEQTTEEYDYVRQTGLLGHLEILTSAATMKCASCSLLAYAYKAMSRNDKALEYFQKAYDVSSNTGEAARLNIDKLQKESFPNRDISEDFNSASK